MVLREGDLSTGGGVGEGDMQGKTWDTPKLAFQYLKRTRLCMSQVFLHHILRNKNQLVYKIIFFSEFGGEKLVTCVSVV